MCNILREIKNCDFLLCAPTVQALDSPAHRAGIINQSVQQALNGRNSSVCKAFPDTFRPVTNFQRSRNRMVVKPRALPVSFRMITPLVRLIKKPQHIEFQLLRKRRQIYVIIFTNCYARQYNKMALHGVSHALIR